jgi:hypothetical protein
MDFPEGTERTPPENPYSFGGFLLHVLKIALLQSIAQVFKTTGQANHNSLKRRDWQCVKDI